MPDRFRVSVPMSMLMAVAGIRENAAMLKQMQQAAPGDEPVYIESPRTFRYDKPPAPEGASKEIVLLCQTDTMRGAIHVFRKGSEEELHSHKTVDGFWMVLSGRIRFYGDNELLQVLNIEPDQGFQHDNHAKGNYDKQKMNRFDGRTSAGLD